MKTRNILLIMLLSWIAGLACCNIITCNTSQPMPVADDKQREEKTERLHKEYRQQAITIGQRNVQLEKDLQQVKVDLQNTRQSNHQWQLALKQSVYKQQLHRENKDTAASLSNCDTVIQQATAFIQVAHQQDSLQEAITGNLTTQLSNRDTIILIKESQQLLLLQELQYNKSQQGALAKQLTYYQKKVKRQQFAGKLKSFGIVLLSGITIRQLMR